MIHLIRTLKFDMKTGPQAFLLLPEMDLLIRNSNLDMKTGPQVFLLLPAMILLIRILYVYSNVLYVIKNSTLI